MQDHAHHISHIHSVSGKLMGGSTKDIARKYMRTAATAGEVSAGVAGIAGTVTAQPELLAYAALAVPISEGLRYESSRL
jgi:cytochrome c551/c552